MREMTAIEKHYNKFNEDKRLLTRHGQVEFVTSMKYIHKCLENMENPKILDVGAGTGRYTVALANEGYDVTAVELVQHNVGIIKQKGSSAKVYKGNAKKLSRFEDGSFDVVLMFGPMYHLCSFEDKLKALKEGKRVLKPGGRLLVAYFMNDYRVIRYAFKEKHVKECIEKNMLSDDFMCISKEDDLYHSVRLENIEKLNNAAGLKRIKIIAADGAANYIRPVLNSLDEEEFAAFIEYHLAICERMDMMGASAHTVDILTK